MGVTISKGSIETVSRLIRNEFEKIDWSLEFIYNKADELIQTATDFNLYDLAEELKNDKQVA